MALNFLRRSSLGEDPRSSTSVARLADPDLLAAAVGHMKDLMSIAEAQRRVAPAAATPTPGGGVAAGVGGQGVGGGPPRRAPKAKAKGKADGSGPAGAESSQ